MSGDASMQAMIDRVRRLGTMPEEVARASLPGVDAAAKKTAAAGTTPEGKTWAPRKADGKPALVNAAEAVTARARGPVVQLVLGATSTGSAKVQAIQSVKRPIIPSGADAIPSPVAAAITKAAGDVFRKITGTR